MGNLFRLKKVYAHCDIPCGIYDPHAAQIAALTVLRMTELLAESKDIHEIARYTVVKEEHAENCKREIRILFGDYFKEEHLKKYPDLYDLIHKIMELGSQARQGQERGVANKLVDAVNRVAEIFWESKGIQSKSIKAPYKVEAQIILPEL